MNICLFGPTTTWIPLLPYQALVCGQYMQLCCYSRCFAARVHTPNMDCYFSNSDSREDVIVGRMGPPNSISWLFSSLPKRSAGLVPISKFHIFRVMTSLNPALRACTWTRSHCKKLLLYVRTTSNSGIWSPRVFVVAKSLESNIFFRSCTLAAPLQRLRKS